MTHRLLALFALVLFVSPVQGCSHGEGRGTTAEAIVRIPALPLPSLVDPEALGVFHADLALITGTSLWGSMREWVEVLTEGTDSGDAVLTRSILGSTELVLYLVQTESGEPRAIGLLRGNFSRQDALAFQRDADQVSERMHGPFVVFDVATDGAVTLVGDHTIVFGLRSDVDAVLDRQLAGGNGSYPRGEAYTSLATSVGFDRMPVGFALVPTERMRRTASGEADPLFSAISSARGVGFGLDLRDGLVGRAVLQLDSSIAAMGVATLARAQLGSLAQEPEVAATGLAPLLRYVEIDREGSSIVVDLNAPADRAETAFQEFNRFLSARGR